MLVVMKNISRQNYSADGWRTSEQEEDLSVVVLDHRLWDAVRVSLSPFPMKRRVETGLRGSAAAAVILALRFVRTASFFSTISFWIQPTSFNIPHPSLLCMQRGGKNADSTVITQLELLMAIRCIIKFITDRRHGFRILSQSRTCFYTQATMWHLHRPKGLLGYTAGPPWLPPRCPSDDLGR